jgi:hypothetical protein
LRVEDLEEPVEDLEEPRLDDAVPQGRIWAVLSVRMNGPNPDIIYRA